MSERPILFVTGLSGAGISTALKALEDCGYEVFDNFPLGHVETLLSEKGYENHRFHHACAKGQVFPHLARNYVVHYSPPRPIA